MLMLQLLPVGQWGRGQGSDADWALLWMGDVGTAEALSFWPGTSLGIDMCLKLEPVQPLLHVIVYTTLWTAHKYSWL